MLSVMNSCDLSNVLLKSYDGIRVGIIIALSFENDLSNFFQVLVGFYFLVLLARGVLYCVVIIQFVLNVSGLLN